MTNKLAPLITDQLPSYVHDKYPIFVSFLKTYFEWLDETDNYSYFLNSFKENMDIDHSNDDYVEQFLQEFAEGIPHFNLKIPKNQLIKLIREFYISKGTEESFKFIFRIMYDKDVNVTYPREFILASSDNNYEGDFVMNLSKTIGKEYFITSDSIINVTDNVSEYGAFIDTLEEKVDILGNHYFKAYLSSYDEGLFNQLNMTLKLQIDDIIYNTEVIRTINDLVIDDGGIAFDVGDDIYIDSDIATGNSGFFANIISTNKGRIGNIEIINGGDNFQEGDYIQVDNTSLTTGYGFSGKVKEVDGSGTITKVEILANGYNYEDEQVGIVTTNYSGIAPTIQPELKLTGDDLGSIKRFKIRDGGIVYDENAITLLNTSINGNNEVLTPIFSNIFETPKINTNQKGFTSHNNVLTDSWYYQQFSYLVASYEKPNQWKHIIKKMIHPAGLVQFNQWIYESESNTNDIIGFKDSSYVMTFIIKLILEANERFLVSSEGLPVSQIAYLGDPQHRMVGHNLRDLDSEKFTSTFNNPISLWYPYSIDNVLNGKSIELNNTNETTVTISVI